jgi:hypothetical protein
LTTTTNLTNLDRRVAQLEHEHERQAIPSILFHRDPTTAKLKPEVEAALAGAGAHCIVLPPGRSADDARLERDREFFID